MNARTREVLEAALALPPEERELLMEELAAREEGHDGQPHVVDDAEIESRIEDFVAGRTQAGDPDEALAQLRGRLGHR